MLPEVGEEGQQKLRNARVLIVGVGGLGCPAAQYLAAAGVGNLILADHDLVDASNLHRQILFTEADLGRPKAVAAREALLRANPGLSIEAKTESLGPGNAVEWFQSCDLVIDGTDNFQAKYLINDACLLAGKPWVYASVYRFQGQLSVFNYQNGPTYRCLFPAPPRQQLTCEEVGVLGVLPGLLGVMQAAEALKMILTLGTVFSGKVKWLDLLTMEEQIIHFQRNEAEIRKILTRELTPEVWYCEQDAEGKCYLDVRERQEQPRLSGAQVIEIPLRELADRLPEIPRNQEVFVFCQSGIRSARAIELLREAHGFQNLRQVEGGIQSIIQ